MKQVKQCAVALLGAIACLGLPTHADEFTVAHSGANVAASQYGVTGAGIGVAVLDSGVKFSNELAETVKGGPSRIVAKALFATTNTDDFCGHGTHVAAIIAGNGAASSGSGYFRTFKGIAPNTNIINVKVLDNQGRGTVSQTISGIQWCIANKTRFNIRVMNLSLGHEVGESYTTDPLCQAVEAAYRAGIVVVCAAGNNGRANTTQTPGMDNEGWGSAYGSIQSPANDPYVITVGAMKQNLSTAVPGAYTGNRVADKITTYSSRGPSRLDFVMKPDIVAPGNRVISAIVDKGFLDTTYSSTNLVRENEYRTGSTSISKQYFYLSGTSMAAPVVAGAAALLLQKYPTLTPDSVKARLMLSADKWMMPNGGRDITAYGAGYLNIPAALANTAVATKSAVSPRLFRDAVGNVLMNTSDLFKTDQVIWGTSGLNNLQGIWGDQVIWGTQVIWGSQVLWGDANWTDQVIWGTGSSTVDLTSTAINGEN